MQRLVLALGGRRGGAACPGAGQGLPAPQTEPVGSAGWWPVWSEQGTRDMGMCLQNGVHACSCDVIRNTGSWESALHVSLRAHADPWRGRVHLGA